MNSLHLAILNAYSALAVPYRRARLMRLAAQASCPISVLFYHRVADTHPNDWTISTEQFVRHLDYCQARFEFIDLAEVQRRVAQGSSNTPAVALTFDDGYRDNCDFAIPELLRRGIPCTYFATTEPVQNQTPFAHDVRAGQPLAVNSVRQLREMSAAGIEIGCHSRTHIDFAKVSDRAVIRREIVDAKNELEQMIGCRVRYFAFPFGMPAQLTPPAIEAIHQAGFEGFCSAYGGYNVTGREAFHIRRCHGDPEFPRLRNWLSYDARKSRREPRVPEAGAAITPPAAGVGPAETLAPSCPVTR